MILSIYSIHDNKAMAHLPPFTMARDELAIRIFADCVNDEKHSFCAHPEDYTLFHHGHFECDNGEFFIEDKRSLGNGVDFIQIPLHKEQLELLERNVQLTE